MIEAYHNENATPQATPQNTPRPRRRRTTAGERSAAGIAGENRTASKLGEMRRRILAANGEPERHVAASADVWPPFLDTPPSRDRRVSCALVLTRGRIHVVADTPIMQKRLQPLVAALSKLIDDLEALQEIEDDTFGALLDSYLEQRAAYAQRQPR